jgi:hypothetical protein
MQYELHGKMSRHQPYLLSRHTCLGKMMHSWGVEDGGLNDYLNTQSSPWRCKDSIMNGIEESGLSKTDSRVNTVKAVFRRPCISPAYGRIEKNHAQTYW